VRNPKSILITGASSGIGAALARAYAEPGAQLALVGRNEDRLAAVAAACHEAGAATATALIDVTAREALARWIAEVDETSALDLIIANAGISAGTGRMGESDAQAREIMAVNLEGVINTVLPALGPLRARRRGQVAIISSLAAFRGFPGAPAYCASKAAVKVWGEALRGHLAAEGIGVSVVCPGFVRSRMTAVNAFPMPFLMEVDRAAAIIKRGLTRNKARIAFPWPLAAAAWLLAALPPAVTDPLLRRLPEKA
jgi:short-subunit dehydrogenase